MSSRSDIKPDGVLVVDHNASGAQVGPTFFGIVGDVNAASADVPAAILLEPTRSRKRQKIDIFSTMHVLECGSFFNHRRRNMFESLGSLAPLRDKSQRTEILWHSQAQTESLGRPERIDENPIAFWITSDGIE